MPRLFKLPLGRDPKAVDYNRLLDAAIYGSSGASDPAAPVRGQVRMRDDGTINGMGLEVYYGATTGWRPPWNQPWGRLDQSGFFAVVTSGTTDTVGASRLIDATNGGGVPGRRIQMDYHHDSAFGSVVGDIFQVNLTMDSAVLGSALTNVYIAVAGNYYPPAVGRRIFTTTGTSHTFRTVAKRVSGTGTLDHRGYTYIYDIGPATAPPAS